MSALECIPASNASADNDEDDGDFDDWASEAGDAPIQSILDPSRIVESAAAAWDELRSAVGFDYNAFRRAREFDEYGVVRLVNYVRGVVRSTEAAPDAICDALKVALEPSRIDAGAPLWGDDALLAPVLADDGLILAVLGDNASENEEPTRNTPALVCSEAHVDEDAPRASDSDAAATIAALSAELASARNLMERLVAGADDGLSSDSDESVSSENGRRNTRRRKRAADNDTYYFDSYAQLSIHRDMLRDAVRTDSYRDAIEGVVGGIASQATPRLEDCRSVVRDKVVIDVGCGTGILSMFAARAGASRVVALDASDIVHDAREIITTNGLDDVVRVVRGKAEEVDLRDPLGTADGRADVIISEWMGYALLYECMLSSVLAVRDAFLRPGGRMLPSHASICVAAYSDAASWTSRVASWSNVYGFDMSVMRRHIFDEPVVEVLPPTSIVSSPVTLRAFNLETMSPAEQDILAAPFEFTLTCEGPLHGVALWFDIRFAGVLRTADSAAALSRTRADVANADECPDLEDAVVEAAPNAQAISSAVSRSSDDDITFSTGPAATPTHWLQTLLLLREPTQPLPVGTVVSGTLSMARDAGNPRQYRFVLDIRSPVAAQRQQSFHMR